MCFLKGRMHERIKNLRRGSDFCFLYQPIAELTQSCKNSILSKSGTPRPLSSNREPKLISFLYTLSSLMYFITDKK